MVDVEEGARGDCGGLSDIGSRNLCLQLDLDRVQKQRYGLGLLTIAASSDRTGCCADMVRCGGRTAAPMAGTVEVGGRGNCGGLRRVVRRIIYLQLVLDRIPLSWEALGLVESTAGADDCGCSADLVQHAAKPR